MKGRPKTADGSLAKVRGLIGKAQEGDAAAMARLRECVGEDAEFWNLIGELAKSAERAWVQTIARKNRLSEEGIQRRLKKMKGELCGPACSPLERLLVERVAICWLQVQYADLWYPHKLAEGMSFEAGDYYQRRQDRAHRRLLSAIRTLALVRKLALPVLQVNIGEKQVNVAQVTQAAGAREKAPEGEAAAAPRQPDPSRRRDLAQQGLPEP